MLLDINNVLIDINDMLTHINTILTDIGEFDHIRLKPVSNLCINPTISPFSPWSVAASQQRHKRIPLTAMKP